MKHLDQKILNLIDILKQLEIIRFDVQFCEAIDLRKQNLYNIRQGKNCFTPEHISSIIKTYNVNANWIFGNDEKIFLKKRSQTRTQI